MLSFVSSSRALVAGVAVLGALTLNATTASAAKPSSDTASKPYSVTINPPSAPAGGRTTFTAVFSVPADAQHQLGAAQLTPRAGFSLVAGAVSSSSGTVSQSGNTITVNNAAVQPGNTLTVTMDADISCSATGTLPWTVAAKQANEFNGTGNLLDLVGPVPTTRVDGACRLAFVNHPANARVNEPITSTAYDVLGLGPAVSVEVLDGSNTRVTSSTASVTLATNTGPAALGGTTTVSAVSGLASFSPLRLGTPGSYTLRATSTGLTQAISNTFRIDTAGVYCFDDVPCTATASTRQTQADATAFPGGGENDNDAGFLTLSMNTGPQIDCANYDELSPDRALVDMTSAARTKEVTLTIDKKLMAVVPNNGASFMQFCFGSPTPFATTGGPSTQQGTFDWDSNGTPDPVYVGLLPNCGPATPPCVTKRSKTGAGDGVITATLPAGDPAMRG